MKKLINKPEDVVVEELQGIEIAHPDLVKVHYEPNYIVRADAPVKGKVALVSGGEADTNQCMAVSSAWVCWMQLAQAQFFTSPTPDQMLEATKAVDGGAGVLHIVKNYTGDIMNFEMAADLAKGEGIDVESVVVDDDVCGEGQSCIAGWPPWCGTDSG